LIIYLIINLNKKEKRNFDSIFSFVFYLDAFCSCGSQWRILNIESKWSRRSHTIRWNRSQFPRNFRFFLFLIEYEFRSPMKKLFIIVS